MINSHIYSIDINKRSSIGKYVNKLFPNLLSKWTLYKVDITVKLIEKIERG